LVNKTAGTYDVLQTLTASSVLFCFPPSSFQPADLNSSLICLFFQGVVRGRVMWPLIFTVYLSMPDFRKGILAGMGFGVLLCVLPFWTDSALLQALKDLWDRRWNAFVLPWGHMTPHLEDVARITGLRVHGDPVTGQTLGDYREMARDLL